MSKLGNPKKKKPPAHTKATKQDWLIAARTILIDQGIERVKVLTLAETLEVSRSSFYWYFKDREELLEALLSHWQETNTAAILDQSSIPASNIFEAITNLFECWVDEDFYDPRFDFAIREWSRRSPTVRTAVDQADEKRVQAIAAMFESHDYVPGDAFTRARVLYFMQIGYYAIELGETPETRMLYIGRYLENFSGQKPSDSEIKTAVERLKIRSGITS